MKKFLLILSFAAAMMSVSCEKEQTDIITSHDRALVIVPPGGSEIVYELKSAYRCGHPTQDAFFDFYFFYTEDDSVIPVTIHNADDSVESYLPSGELPTVSIYGRYILSETEKKYFTYEYRYDKTIPLKIIVRGLDPSLGLGKTLTIYFEDGKYNASNERIDLVKINSYVPSTFRVINPHIMQVKSGKDSNINIYIRSKSGTVISIRYIGGGMFP